MKKRLSSWLFGSLLAVAGLPTAALAQTASTGSPFTVTESNSYSESWTTLGSLLKNDVWTVEDNNNDNHTWDDLSTGMPTYDGSNATVTADDWLVSPRDGCLLWCLQRYGPAHGCSLRYGRRSHDLY